MKLIPVFSGLLTAILLLPAAADQSNSRCPAVNCDCSAFAETKLRDLCAARETQVVSECVSNQGKPKSFCGLHGPKATPVALSLQSHATPAPVDTREAETLRQLITTQSWSLEESFKALSLREKSQQFGDAIQVLNLLERDSERLYDLHKQLVSGLQSAQRPNEATDQGVASAQNTLVWARQVRAYGEQLWQRTQAADNERSVKAYRALALKSGRLAGEIYEFGADLYAQVGKSQESAGAWQEAAAVAQALIAWERAGDNKAQHVEFYQAQAVARWHRATYLWLAADNKERVAATLEQAVAIGGEQTEFDSHSQQEARAIKRGSR